MNGAELHLVVNHAPAIFAIAALILIIWGLLARNQGLQTGALALLILVGIVSWMSMATGEGAEEVAEKFGADHHLIHPHEEMAEKSFWISVVVGLLAVFSLWRMRMGLQAARLWVVITTLGALFGLGATGYTALLGGVIMHKEIRKDATEGGLMNESGERPEKTEAQEQPEEPEHEEAPEKAHSEPEAR